MSQEELDTASDVEDTGSTGTSDNYLDASDESMEHIDINQLIAMEADTPDSLDNEEADEDTENGYDDVGDTDDPDESYEDSSEYDDDDELNTARNTRSAESDEDEADDEEEAEDDDDTESGEIDYEASYKKILDTFNKDSANGFTIDDPEEVVQLMKRGAEYANIAPHLKSLKALEKSGLLSSNAINFLIDLNNGDEKAIAKLLRDKEIDPLDIDIDDDGEVYKPNDHSVSDSEVDLQTVIDEISSSPTYEKTADVVVNWDSASKDILADNPTIIRYLHEQVGNGMYDAITATVKKQRVLGGLKGLSDLEAYRQVGDFLKSQGALDKFLNPEETKKASAKTKSEKLTSSIKAKRKAASPTGRKRKATSLSRRREVENVLAMSDEEFEKAHGSIN